MFNRQVRETGLIKNKWEVEKGNSNQLSEELFKLRRILLIIWQMVRLMNIWQTV